MADREHFLTRLYPLQDEVLRVLTGLETGFYLSGGTAASRGYLQHRFSDDLDLFVNDAPEFGLWSDRLIRGLMEIPTWKVAVLQRELRFVRILLDRAGLQMKVEMVNDVPSRAGAIRVHPSLGRLDSAENILANKITALVDRQEPKDLADVWGFCVSRDLSIQRAIEDARGKAAGIFPVDVARVLLSATRRDWELVRWIEAPDPRSYLASLKVLAEQLLLL